MSNGEGSGGNRSGRFWDTAPGIRLADNHDNKKRTLNILGYTLAILKTPKAGGPDDIYTALHSDFKIKEVYRNCWEEAKKYFEANKKTFANDVPDEYHIAVICYTRNEIYKDFNKATRELANRGLNITVSDVELTITTASSASVEVEYPFKSLFLLLQEACNTIKAIEIPANQKLYTGFKGKFTARVGQSILFNQFLSTSRQKCIALNFASGGDPTQDWTLFHIILKKGSCVWLGQHSVIPEEDEVLLSPFIEFKCRKESKVEGLHGTHIYLEAEGYSIPGINE